MDERNHVTTAKEDIAALRAEVRALTGTVTALSGTVKTLSGTIEELVTAWETSKGILFVVKWGAAVAASIAVAWAAITGHGR